MCFHSAYFCCHSSSHNLSGNTLLELSVSPARLVSLVRDSVYSFEEHSSARPHPGGFLDSAEYNQCLLNLIECQSHVWWLLESHCICPVRLTWKSAILHCSSLEARRLSLSAVFNPVATWNEVQLVGVRFMGTWPVKFEQGPALDLLLGCRYPENLNNFIFEVVFCEWSANEQWSMHMVREDLCNSMSASLLSHSHVAFMMSHEHRVPWPHIVWASSENQSTRQGHHVHDWINQGRGEWVRGGRRKRGKATLSTGTRPCFYCRRKGIYSSKHQWQRNPIISFHCVC